MTSFSCHASPMTSRFFTSTLALKAREPAAIGRSCLGARHAWRGRLQRLLLRANHANQQSFRSPGLKERSEEVPGSSGSPVALAPLAGRFSFQQLRNISDEQLVFELRIRGLSTLGRRMQLVSRVYQAFREENMVWATGDAGGSGSDSEGGQQLGSSGSSGSSAGGAGPEAELSPLQGLQRSMSGVFLRSAEESVMSNSTGAQVLFLWGHTAPNGVRVATSTAMRTKRSVWLFDCGEDTQRHLLRNPTISWVRIDRLFVSSMSPETVLGLPGMLCTISAARAKGHENADTPLHVYGPPGLVEYINNMLTVSRTYLEMPVIIHEFTTRAPSAAQLASAAEDSDGPGLFSPVLVNKRARLYAMQLFPDQLNPQGYYDGEVRTMLARHRRKKSGGGIDARAGTLPLPLPDPGDPSAAPNVRLSELVWTIRVDHEFYVRAAPLKHRQPCFGYLVREADRAGRLDPEAAIALGVRPGEAFTLLKEGQAVPGHPGTMVQPEQVVGRPRRGRRWAVVGPCYSSDLFARGVGEGADLLVHSLEPPFTPAPDPEAASAARDAAATAAGACAAALGAQELVLWESAASFLLTPDAEDPDFPERVLRLAEDSYGSSSICFGGTFTAHQFEQQEA